MPIAWEVGRVILRLRNTGRFDLGRERPPFQAINLVLRVITMTANHANPPRRFGGRGNSSGALGYSESRMR